MNANKNIIIIQKNLDSVILFHILVYKRRMLMKKISVKEFYSEAKMGELYISKKVTTRRVAAKHPLVGKYVVQVSNPVTHKMAMNMAEKFNLITYEREDKTDMFVVLGISEFSKKGTRSYIVARKLLGRRAGRLGDPVHFIDRRLIGFYKEE